VRYATFDTWSNILLIRGDGKSKFSTEQVQLLDAAMESIGWLHATAEEALPAESLRGITPRQSEVMLMLLDGYPRKVIAARLKIGQETVGIHIKAIYKHFDVNSSSELAALFLRGK
jgi:DNA-binding NarL/FixJ family response regulator